METFFFVLFVIFVIAVVAFMLVIALISGFMWLWAILSLVFVFFRNGNIGGKIFRLAWKLLIISVVLNLIGFILLLQFPSLRNYEDNPVRERIEQELDDETESLTCKKAGSLVFDADVNGLQLDNYTYVIWVDDDTERYAVLSPGTWDFKKTIHAGKATGYVGNDCNTAVVKQIVGDRHWASKSTIESFFEKR